MNGLVGLATVILTITTVLCGIFGNIKNLSDHFVRRVVLIGVIHEMPDCLKPLKDYTSVFQARKSTEKVVILRCGSLKKALKHCDWVVYDWKSTPNSKIKPCSDEFWSELVSEQ